MAEHHSKLWNAILNNASLDEIKSIIDAGADINETDYKGYNVLTYAVLQNKNPAVIKYLINKGLSVNQMTKEDLSLAHFAAKNPCPEIMETLIEQGVAFDKEDSNYKKTPLSVAALIGSREVCEVLIKAGSNLEKRDREGKTPLLLSTMNPDPNVFRFLLKSGAKSKAVDNNRTGILINSLLFSKLELVKEIIAFVDPKLTSLPFYSEVSAINEVTHGAYLKIITDKSKYRLSKQPCEFYAASNPDIRVLKYLESRGCNISASKNEKINLLTLALRYNSNPKVINYLLSKGFIIRNNSFLVENLRENPFIEMWKKALNLGLPKHYIDENGNSLLMTVLLHNDNPNSEILELLCDQEIVNAKDKFGLTACHFAAMKDNPIYLDILLKAGAKIDEKNNDGITPLMGACMKNPNPFIIDYLIQNKADINERNAFGYDALLSSVSNPNPDISKYLISLGADIHTKDREGENLLMKALKIGSYPEVISFYLSLGLDINEKDNSGNTAIIYAAAYNPYVEVFQLLLKSGANLKTVTDKKEDLLIFAARNNPNYEIIIYLLQNGLKINSSTLDGETPLLAAARNSNINIIKTIIKNGANIRTYDKKQMNALFVASNYNDNPKIVEYLLDNGFNINETNEFGNSAVLYAAGNSNINVIKTLVARGADLNSTNNSGSTTLMMASTSPNYMEMAKFLIENGVDVNARTADNVTALMYAASVLTDPAYIDLLVTAGADVFAEDDNGYTAYKIAEECNPNPAVAATIKKYSLMQTTVNTPFGIPSNININ